jgi:hypothetical protein
VIEDAAMFPTRQLIFLLHLNGKVIRSTADHPLFVPGKGWTEAADVRPGDPLHSHNGDTLAVEGVADSDEKAVVYHLNPVEHPMPDQLQPTDNRRPILGFAAGTPIRTAGGSKPIEDVKPGDFIQTGPDGEEPDDGHDDIEQARGWERK